MPVMSGFTGEFETRDLGESFQISLPNPVWTEDSPRTYNGEWSFEMVTRKADLVHLEMPSIEGKTFKSRYPQFQRQTLNGNGLDPGIWRTVGVMTKPMDGGGPGDKLLTIMKFELIEVKP